MKKFFAIALFFLAINQAYSFSEEPTGPISLVIENQGELFAQDAQLDKPLQLKIKVYWTGQDKGPAELLGKKYNIKLWLPEELILDTNQNFVFSRAAADAHTYIYEGIIDSQSFKQQELKKLVFRIIPVKEGKDIYIGLTSEIQPYGVGITSGIFLSFNHGIGRFHAQLGAEGEK